MVGPFKKRKSACVEPRRIGFALVGHKKTASRRNAMVEKVTAAGGVVHTGSLCSLLKGCGAGVPAAWVRMRAEPALQSLTRTAQTLAFRSMPHQTTQAGWGGCSLLQALGSSQQEIPHRQTTRVRTALAAADMPKPACSGHQRWKKACTGMRQQASATAVMATVAPPPDGSAHSTDANRPGHTPGMLTRARNAKAPHGTRLKRLVV